MQISGSTLIESDSVGKEPRTYIVKSRFLSEGGLWIQLLQLCEQVNRKALSGDRYRLIDEV